MPYPDGGFFYPIVCFLLHIEYMVFIKTFAITLALIMLVRIHFRYLLLACPADCLDDIKTVGIAYTLPISLAGIRIFIVSEAEGWEKIRMKVSHIIR